MSRFLETETRIARYAVVPGSLHTVGASLAVRRSVAG